MMISVKIPEPQWHQFCESFTDQHRGWLVNLYQLETRQLEQEEVSDNRQRRKLPSNRPLQEVREDSHNNHPEIMVTIGQGQDETSVLIENAIALFSLDEANQQSGFRVDSDNGFSTLLEFRSAVAPESVDGITD